MADFWEIFKDFDFNNIIGVIVISVFLIITFANCMEPLFASHTESFFMGKADVLKRKCFACIILFFIFGVMNYVFASINSFVAAGLLILIIAIILYIGIRILNMFKKYKDSLFKIKEFVKFILITVFFIILTYLISNESDINIISCAAICSLVEIIVIVLALFSWEPMDSEMMLCGSNEKWYVYRRIDDCFLCGDNKNINSAEKIKLIKIDIILNDNYYFKRSN